MSERDWMARIERHRMRSRKAMELCLSHNPFCECQGCQDIHLRLAPKTIGDRRAPGAGHGGHDE